MPKDALNSRQRLQKTLNHEPVDQVCVDFGATAVTGIAVSTLSKLRQTVLGEKDYRVKVIEPYQMLGELDSKLMEALGIDVMGVFGPKNMFGFENKDWKPFTLFDGTEVLVPGDFNVTPDGEGGLFLHPQGDTSVPPSGHMPKDGFYFDAICRQEPIDEEKLNPADNCVEFGVLSESDIEYYKKEAKAAAERGKGAVLTSPGTPFGDIAMIPAVGMKHTPGIRDVEEWYVSTVARRDYVYAVFEKQCEIALENLGLLAEALGDDVQAVFTTGTDFGMQTGLFISPQAYRDLYKPFHKAINDFIHQNTSWKVFIHSCGAVKQLIPEFIEAGFDILNPVQCSAAGMEPQELVDRFGKDITFWGGLVDTQNTLPFGTPEEVYREVSERIEIFQQKNGFAATSIHNIQSNVPIDNVVAMFKALGRDF
ncbi:uroporphyrinogen decarboxylase family protein [Sedimentisphaera salicampi]|uniref:Methylcobalamin:coenzyme M methyltransferase n=1 Tax=Sedimentisphaera salicampi TaxID=1941349 RepID=A0A1W6LKF7_9BACT|nr:uroporphyrinogen decarboxylase family protein [Sedimentisphaera salicampi]ARN56257.1 methylcobalamin:coenzyme M methyltransferase [Sedimentisphaera salicampi]